MYFKLFINGFKWLYFYTLMGFLFLKIYFTLKYSYTCRVGWACTCMTSGVRKRLSDLLEPELAVVVSPCGGVLGNELPSSGSPAHDLTCSAVSPGPSINALSSTF